MTDGRDRAGGFRWNLTPGSGTDGDADGPPERPAATEPPAAPEAPIAPVDDWDVPTAASPIVGRSVFPLGPPAGAPALLPPPYIPRPGALEPPLPPLPPPLDSSLEGVTELLGAQPVGLPDPVDEGLETTDIDVVFGESRFLDYDAPADLVAPPAAPVPYTPPMFPPAEQLPATTVMPGAVVPPRSSLPFDALPPLPASTMALYEGPQTIATHVMPRSQKILIGVAGGLVAVLALVALFLLGMRIGERSPATEAVVTPTAKPSASALPVATVGPVAAGDHTWDELLGGECLAFYDSPWQDTYTVVDCAEPHTGQLLSKGTFPDAAGVVYPATTDLQARATLECSAPTVIDYAAASAYDDIQLESSFPATAEQWDAGARTYYCFATRSGGDDLTGSLAVRAA